MDNQERLTQSFQYTTSSLLALKNSFYPRIDLFGNTTNFEQSLINNKRIPLQYLRNFSKSIPARKAIRRVTNGVLAMPWVIKEEYSKNDQPTSMTKKLTRALQRPNREEHNTYLKLCRAIINEIITLGFAAVERQKGNGDQPFWLWIANAETIYLNPLWYPGNNEQSRYYQRVNTRMYGIPEQPYAPFVGQDAFLPIDDDNLFLITFDNNSYELIPPGPLEIAYEMISAWLGLSSFQKGTTSNAVREYLMVVKNTSQEELKSFRQYWMNDVIGKGEIPIIGGESENGNFDVEVIKLGARNDEELYPKYTEYVLKIIALAFDLANRDYGITDHDNRATSGFAADSTFADAILPMAINLRESLSYEVIGYYEPGHYFDYIDTEPRNQLDEANTANVLYGGGILKLNEARLRVNEEPIEDGDKFKETNQPNQLNSPQQSLQQNQPS